MHTPPNDLELRPQPSGEGTLAVVDETTPFVGGGVCYVVASGVLLSDQDEARDQMRSVIPAGRVRPFHWNQEGITAKRAMIDALSKIGVLGRSIVVPCGRRSQERARAIGLATLVDQLLDDGCDQLIIESRTPAQNGRDQAVILDVLRDRPEARAPTYSWEKKANELLWIADAIGGAVHDHLTSRDAGDDWFGQVEVVTGLTLEYRCLTP